MADSFKSLAAHDAVTVRRPDHPKTGPFRCLGLPGGQLALPDI